MIQLLSTHLAVQQFYTGGRSSYLYHNLKTHESTCMNTHKLLVWCMLKLSCHRYLEKYSKQPFVIGRYRLTFMVWPSTGKRLSTSSSSNLQKCCMRHLCNFYIEILIPIICYDHFILNMNNKLAISFEFWGFQSCFWFCCFQVMFW